jgi:hypothetical protein
MPPAVGAQVTFAGGASNSDPAAVARLDTLRRCYDSTWVDIVAKGRVNGQPRGWLYVGGDQWKPDKATQPLITTAALRALGGPGSEVTVTGVPRGSGTRMGIDRDRDGFLDGDELDAHSDPGNPASTPLNSGIGSPPDPLRDTFGSIGPNPFRDRATLRFSLAAAGPVDVAVYDLFGRQVRRVASGTQLGAGPQQLYWDGRDDSGRQSRAGVYFVRVQTPMAQWSRMVVRIH